MDYLLEKDVVENKQKFIGESESERAKARERKRERETVLFSLKGFIWNLSNGAFE